MWCTALAGVATGCAWGYEGGRGAEGRRDKLVFCLIWVDWHTYEVVDARRSGVDVPPEDITVPLFQRAACDDDSGATETTVGFAPDLAFVVLLFTQAFT